MSLSYRDTIVRLHAHVMLSPDWIRERTITCHVPDSQASPFPPLGGGFGLNQRAPERSCGVEKENLIVSLRSISPNNLGEFEWEGPFYCCL